MTIWYRGDVLAQYADDFEEEQVGEVEKGGLEQEKEEEPGNEYTVEQVEKVGDTAVVEEKEE